jgi:hypothetical protein
MRLLAMVRGGASASRIQMAAKEIDVTATARAV